MSGYNPPRKERPIGDTVIRRRILVDRRFQLQYLYIWLWVGIAMVVMSLLFYLLGARVLGVRQLDPSITRFLSGLSGLVLLFCVLMGLLSVVLTHRVAGAAYRLERCIRELSEGKLDGRIALRSSDYLQNLAEALNELQASLKGRAEQRARLAERLEKAIEAGKLAPEERALIEETSKALRGQLSLPSSPASMDNNAPTAV